LWVTKCGPTPKIGIFSINLPKRGIRDRAISDFCKIWLGEEVPGLHPHAQFYGCGFKNGNFWYKAALKGIFWWSTEKVEYRCTTIQTFLYAMIP